MPEENYLKFDKWMRPILKQMLLEQNTQVCGLYFELSFPVRKVCYKERKELRLLQ